VEDNPKDWQIIKRVDVGDVIATLIALLAVLAVFFRLEAQVSLNSADIEDNALAIQELRIESREQFRRIDYKLDKIIERLEDKADK
jgi:hypothetical protein